jgi:hypothetical protein
VLIMYAYYCSTMLIVVVHYNWSSESSL